MILKDFLYVLWVFLQRKSTKTGGTIRSESAGSPLCWSLLWGAGHLGVLATSVRGHSPPPQTLLGRRAITVSWRCQFRSGCRIAGAALYSLPAAGGGGDGSIGGRALPGPSVSSARAEQLSGGRVHQQSKQLSPGKLSLQPHSNTIHSTNCRPL